MFVLPSIWIIVRLIGIIFVLVGTGTLTLFRSNHWSNLVEKRIQDLWTENAREGLNTLEVGYPLFSEETGYREIVGLFNDNRYSEVSIPKHSNYEISSLRKGKVDEHGERIKLESESGVVHHLLVTLEDIESAIATHHTYLCERMEDRFTRYGFEILLLGFALQFISYFFQHFTTFY